MHFSICDEKFAVVNLVRVSYWNIQVSDHICFLYCFPILLKALIYIKEQLHTNLTLSLHFPAFPITPPIYSTWFPPRQIFIQPDSLQQVSCEEVTKKCSITFLSGHLRQRGRPLKAQSHAQRKLHQQLSACCMLGPGPQWLYLNMPVERFKSGETPWGLDLE